MREKTTEQRPMIVPPTEVVVGAVSGRKYGAGEVVPEYDVQPVEGAANGDL